MSKATNLIRLIKESLNNIKENHSPVDINAYIDSLYDISNQYGYNINNYDNGFSFYVKHDPKTELVINNFVKSLPEYTVSNDYGKEIISYELFCGTIGFCFDVYMPDDNEDFYELSYHQENYYED